MESLIVLHMFSKYASFITSYLHIQTAEDVPAPY